MSDQTERDTFEAWCKTKGLEPDKCDNANCWIRYAFEGGMQARAALEQPAAEPERAFNSNIAYWCDIRAKVIGALAEAGMEIWSDRDRVWLHRTKPTAEPLSEDRIQEIAEAAWESVRNNDGDWAVAFYRAVIADHDAKQ